MPSRRRKAVSSFRRLSDEAQTKPRRKQIPGGLATSRVARRALRRTGRRAVQYVYRSARPAILGNLQPWSARATESVRMTALRRHVRPMGSLRSATQRGEWLGGAVWASPSALLLPCFVQLCAAHDHPFPVGSQWQLVRYGVACPMDTGFLAARTGFPGAPSSYFSPAQGPTDIKATVQHSTSQPSIFFLPRPCPPCHFLTYSPPPL